MSTKPLFGSRLCTCALLVALARLSSAQTTAVPPLSTTLLLPTGIACDPATGAIYIAERQGNIVRRLTPDGALEIVAGSGVQGFAGDGGAAAAAQLNAPSGVALDSTGNLYIVDTGNHRIREVNLASGTIITLAGSGASGFAGDGGPAVQASLNHPLALALDPTGNLAIADAGNQRIRRVARATGVITTIAGTAAEGFSGDGGPATAATLDQPSGLTFDAAGDLFISDTRNHRVRVIDAVHGQITTVAGATAGTLVLPEAIAIASSGDLVIADRGAERVLALNPGSGALSTIAGSGGEAFAGDGAAAPLALLDNPQGVAISPDGSILVADTGNGRIRRITPSALGVPQIATIAGATRSPSVAITLSGDSVSTYGSGAVTAIVTGSVSAPQVNLFDTTGGVPVLLSTAQSHAGTATFALSALSAGVHHLTAGIPAAAGQSAITSGVWTLTVNPLSIAITPAAATTLFGQPLPSLTGSVSGVLARDSGQVNATFATAATALSPPGTYSITAVLTGSAASNYVAQLTPAALTISKAPSLTSLSADASPTPGTLTVTVKSSTSGVPTGAITLLDAGVKLAGGVLDAAGACSFPTAQFAAGAHQIVAIYAGDADFLSSQSTALSYSSGNASPTPSLPDFSLAPSTSASVSVVSGTAATIGFTATALSGPLAGPIALGVSGLPSFATSAFNPPVLPPGNSVSSFTLTVSTAPTALRRPRQPSSAPVFCVMLLPVALACAGSRKRLSRLTVVVVLVTVTYLTGCGDRVSTAASTGSPSAPAVYTVVVTGTATGADGKLLQHTASVQLTVTP